MLHKTFRVTGTVRNYGPAPTMIVEEETTERPVMLEAAGPMMDYINAQSDSDLEEKYMPLEFIYDMNCELIAILVPSTDINIPAKAVVIGDDLKLRIYGMQGIVSERINPPMPGAEWSACKSYIRDVMGYKFLVAQKASGL